MRTMEMATFFLATIGIGLLMAAAHWAVRWWRQRLYGIVIQLPGDVPLTLSSEPTPVYMGGDTPIGTAVVRRRGGFYDADVTLQPDADVTASQLKAALRQGKVAVSIGRQIIDADYRADDGTLVVRGSKLALINFVRA